MLLGEAIMKSRLLSVALLAAGLGVGTASGQQPPYLPTPVGAARIPEPIPISEPPPPMMQGPLNPYTLPSGPPDTLSLPAGHSSAFQCEEFVREKAVFLHVGPIALQRQRFGGEVLAVQDAIGLDTGIPTAAAVPVINMGDLSEHANWGLTATLGYIWDSCSSLEVTGKYLFSATANSALASPGSLDGLFFNPPIGFEGNNGLWLQADIMGIQRTTELGTGEFNYRYTSPGLTEAELIVGVRYLYFKEQLNLFTDDDGLTFPLANGLPDPKRTATYGVETRNQLVGPQLGFEWDHLLYKFVSFGVTAKGMWGVDFATTRHSLVRGDGFQGFDVQQNTTNYVAGMYEALAFVEFHATEKCRIRAGYDFMWLYGVKLGQDQIDFNLANPAGQDRRSGNVYFQGPTLELQFLF